MAVTKADVVLIAPELSAVADGVFTAYLADAELELDLAAYGERADLAKKLHVAHHMTRSGYGTGGGRGDVTSESVGQVSRSYAAPTSSSSTPSPLSSTRYGQRLIALNRSLSPRVLVVG